MKKLLRWVASAAPGSNAALASEANEQTTQSRIVETQWQVGTLGADQSVPEVKATIAAQNGIKELKLPQPKPLVATPDASGKMVVGHGATEKWIPTPSKQRVKP